MTRSANCGRGANCTFYQFTTSIRWVLCQHHTDVENVEKRNILLVEPCNASAHAMMANSCCCASQHLSRLRTVHQPPGTDNHKFASCPSWLVWHHPKETAALLRPRSPGCSIKDTLNSFVSIRTVYILGLEGVWASPWKTSLVQVEPGWFHLDQAGLQPWQESLGAGFPASCYWQYRMLPASMPQCVNATTQW